ncbi:MAG: hypothetical protein LBH24_03165 [Clostridiales bacterium]|jgi:acyl-ACP thioesterase|nr:hypothetical protein [Clostridiales bacterium]
MLEFKQHFLPLSSDFDVRDRMKVSAYLDMFQTVAGRHSELLRLGARDLLTRGIAWIVAKSRLTVYQSPAPGLRSDVVVSTYPQPPGKLDYIRDYYMHDLDGGLLAKGSAQWLLLDMNTRRILRPILEYPGEYVTFAAYDSTRIDKIDVPSDAAEIYRHRVCRNDIDLNNHTNNIKYAEMLYNAADLPEGREAADFIINYIKETQLGDEIVICHAHTDNGDSLFAGKKNGETVFTAKLQYRSV